MANEDETRRQASRRARRVEGDQSAQLARALMTASESQVRRLELEAELLDAILQARRITALVARRREERALAGTLRAYDLRDLRTRLANVEAGGVADLRAFKQSEAWRDRLVLEGQAAFAACQAELPHVDVSELMTLVAKAQSERANGKPPGAGRALFRYLLATFKLQATDTSEAHTDTNPG